jgi:hypothetical protein
MKFVCYYQCSYIGNPVTLFRVVIKVLSKNRPYRDWIASGQVRKERKPEIFALLGSYAAYIGCYLPTSPDNPSSPSSRERVRDA